MNAIENDRFHEILKPLCGENGIENGHVSLEYHYHLKLLQEFEKRLRHIEMLFGDLHARTAALEKVVSNLKC